MNKRKNILSNKSVIEMNYSLMQLYNPVISYTNKQSIDYSVKEFEYDYNKIEFVKMLKTLFRHLEVYDKSYIKIKLPLKSICSSCSFTHNILFYVSYLKL